VALRTDGHPIAVNVHMNIFLIEPGQVRFQSVSVTLIGNIRLKGGLAVVTEEHPKGVLKKVALKVIHLSKRIISGHCMIISTIQHICYLQNEIQTVANFICRFGKIKLPTALGCYPWVPTPF